MTDLHLEEITITTRSYIVPNFQEQLDELDDDEREQILQELAMAQDVVVQKAMERLDTMMEDVYGLPKKLPPDPTHYTHDSHAIVIDVD